MVKYSSYPFLDKLIFHLYTIGYKSEGECQLFFCETDFGIVYSGLVDCYEKDDNNQAIDLLQEFGIKSLDLLCWTHPHLDHSFGIEKIFEHFVNQNTIIVYPQNLLSINTSDVVDSQTANIDLIKEIILSKQRNKSKTKGVSGHNIVDIRNFGTHSYSPNSGFTLTITSVAPISEIVEKRDLVSKVTQLNDYSIALNITINGRSFFLAGDIQNTTISKIDYYSVPEKIDFLKIPHHCSIHSDRLLDWFEEYPVEIVCTTEYSKSNLPNLDLLNQYKDISNYMYSTHVGTGPSGYLYIAYDVLNNILYRNEKGRMREIV